MEQRADGAVDRTEKVRNILSTRRLTLHRVSERSAGVFGRQSLFYVAHNLYHSLKNPSFGPTIYQILALSHITGYRLSDWLKVFGFDLDAILGQQLLVPRKGTTVLDSTIYDTQAWIPWFVEDPGVDLLQPVVPLGQFIRRAGWRRAEEFLGQQQNRFSYARIGEQDIYAQPFFVPGQIVRADRTRTGVHELKSEERFFLIEHESGWTCSRLAFRDKNSLLLRCPQLPCAERELLLGRTGRILGLVDAEIRIIPSRHSHEDRLVGRHISSTAQPPQELTLRSLLRQARISSGMSFREASGMSRLLAQTLSDSRHFVASGTLSDYEASSNLPRQIPKILTICLLYDIPFHLLLRAAGLPLDAGGTEPIPDLLVPRRAPDRNRGPMWQPPAVGSGSGGLLDAIMRNWEEVPLFLRFCRDEIAGVKNLSVSDVFWVRGGGRATDPFLANGAIVVINRRAKQPSSFDPNQLCDPPLYVLLRRDGKYECGRYTLDDGVLTLRVRERRRLEERTLGNGIDAEVVGRVTTILRLFPDACRSGAPTR
jgi:hypothetical protein